MKNFLIVTASIELGAGIALMCWPSKAVFLLTGTSLEAPAALIITQIGGAGLVALAVACGIARDDAQSRSARGLVTAMFLYNVAAASVITYAGIGYGLNGMLLWPGVILHSAMTIWCIAVLQASKTKYCSNNSSAVDSSREEISPRSHGSH